MKGQENERDAILYYEGPSWPYYGVGILSIENEKSLAKKQHE
jgi:hypothetical protein